MNIAKFLRTAFFCSTPPVSASVTREKYDVTILVVDPWYLIGNFLSVLFSILLHIILSKLFAFLSLKVLFLFFLCVA